MPGSVVSADRSVADLLRDIAVNLQGMVRGELRLAKTELNEELTKAKHAGALMGAGALSGALCLLFLLWSAFFALARVLPDWAAAAAIAIALALTTALLLSAGLKRLKTVKGLPKTVNSMEENIPWAGQQIK